MITLEEAKVGMADKVDQQVVDEFRRKSFLLDKLVFDDAVSPGTGGSTLTYGYTQLKTPSTASRRELNTEYENNEAKREKKTADLDIFGGSFKVDRVLQNTSGAINEIEFQLKQKVKAASNLFHYMVINGSVSNTAGYKQGKFDGIRKLLSGASTEISAEAIDLTTVEMIDKYMYSFVLMINKWLQKMGDKPDMMLMNGDLLAVMQYIGQKMGYYERTKTDFGHEVVTYRGIAMLDAGKFYDGEKEVDCVATDGSTGTSSLIALKIGLDGFHGISPKETSAIIKSYLPDMKAPGAVKTGEAELVAGVVLKNTKMAAILNDIKIAPTV